MATLLDGYQNPNFPGVNGIRRFARRYYGVHMVRADNLQTTPTATNCKADNTTAQIGCLVKTSPCSIGFAIGGAADAGAPFNNVALHLVGIAPSTTNIQNWVTGGTPTYPMAQPLWFNSFQDPNMGFAQPSLTNAELALSNCMGLNGNTTTIDDAMRDNGFVLIPVGTRRFGSCPF